MKTVDCGCGKHLEAANDEELFNKVRAHIDQEHPEMQITDEEVRRIVEEGAPPSGVSDNPPGEAR